MLEARSIGEIYYQGMQNRKHDVYRSPEQTGCTAAKKFIENLLEKITIKDGYYHCHHKNMAISESKIRDYGLKPGAKHSREFFHVGYQTENPTKLFLDIAGQFDISQKQDSRITDSGAEKFSIPMRLGITDKYLFRTVWMDDGPDGTFRLITSFVDRKYNGEDN